MKKQLTLRFLWLLVIIFCIRTTTVAQWDSLGTTAFSIGRADYTSIAIDGNDTAYIGYQDQGNSNKATVMKFNGTSWATLGGAAASAGGCNFTSVAIDGSNNIYIAYQDSANSNKGTVRKYNGSSWSAVGSAGFTSGTASNTSMAIDASNNIYVVYTDGANSGKATVMKYNGSWSILGSAGFSAGSADLTVITIGKNDTPYVAYKDGANSNKVTVMKYNGSSWTTVGSAGISAGNFFYLSLAADTAGALYAGYRDAGNGNRTTVMQYSGGSWSALGGAGFSTGASTFVDVIVHNTTPYVAYRQVGGLFVKTYNGSSWVNLGNSGFYNSSAHNYSTLALDSKGDLYLGFEDASQSYKATVFKYEFPNIWNGSTWSKGTPSSTSDVQIGSSTTPTTFTCRDLTINSGFSLNTGTSEVVTIYGDLTNSGDGVTGTGTLAFAKTGTATISGDTVEVAGTVTVASGCTLATGNILRLTSDASNTGSIGNSAGTISGNVMAQRYSIGKRCYRLYAHPFSTSIALSQLTDEIDITGTGGATNGFTPSYTNAPSAYWFDPTAADTSSSSVNSGWTAFTSTNGTGANSWDQYELLLLYLRGAKGEGLTNSTYTPSASTFEAVGTVNQGTQVISLTKGSNTNFAAVGNPFLSGVQMQNVTPGANVGANYYAWDASIGADGAYVTNAFTLSYILPAYAGFFTTISANTTITFDEADKAAGGVALHKTTAPNNWVELLISDSTTKWDRLLINLDDNAMDVEDIQDAKKLYNPNLDFYTLSKDGARLAIDVRPYADSNSIPLGLTAYNRYNTYVIRTGMFDIPAGTKLVLHDKYLNKTQELKAGAEYWFDVTADSLSQGNNRFEINMVGKPTNGIIEANAKPARMNLVPNPAYNEVKVSFDKLDGPAQLKLMSITGKVVYATATIGNTGSMTIPLQNLPAGIYIVELQGNNARLTQKLIKE